MLANESELDLASVSIIFYLTTMNGIPKESVVFKDTLTRSEVSSIFYLFNVASFKKSRCLSTYVI